MNLCYKLLKMVRLLILRYNNALEAVTAYNKIVDCGFCHIWREAVLVEPNGKAHSKIFERPGSPKYAVN